MTTLQERIARGEFKTHELQSARRLYRKLPTGYTSFEDVLADVRVATLEAAHAYDEKRGASFKTWLYRALVLHSRSTVDHAWALKRKPATATQSDRPVFRLLDQAPSVTLEISELLDGLTPDSQLIMKMVLYSSDDELCRAFADRNRYRGRVSRLLGVSRERVESFTLEVREALPRYLSSVS